MIRNRWKGKLLKPETGCRVLHYGEFPGDRGAVNDGQKAKSATPNRLGLNAGKFSVTESTNSIEAALMDIFTENVSCH